MAEEILINMELSTTDWEKTVKDWQKKSIKDIMKVGQGFKGVEKELNAIIKEKEKYNKAIGKIEKQRAQLVSDDRLTQSEKLDNEKSFNTVIESIKTKHYQRLEKLLQKAQKKQLALQKKAANEQIKQEKQNEQRQQQRFRNIQERGVAFAQMGQAFAQQDIFGGVAIGLGAIPHPAAQAAGAVISAVNGVNQALGNMADKHMEVADKLSYIKTLVSEGEFKFIDDLKGKAEQIAITTGQAVTDILSGAYQAISAGAAQAVNVGQFMEDTAKFARSIGAGVEDSALAIGKMLKALNLPASKATFAMDLLSQTMKKGVTTGSELAQYMPTIAKQMLDIGFTAEQYGAAISTMTPIVKLPETITNLKALSTSLKSVTTIGKLMALEGVEGFNAQKREIVDMEAFLKSMGSAYETNKNQLIDVFDSVEAKQAANILFNPAEGQGLLNMWKGSFSSIAGAFNQMWTVIADSDKLQQEQREQRSEAFERRLGEMYQGVYSSIANAITDLFMTSDDRMKEHIANMQKYKDQAKAIGTILKEGLIIEADFDQASADAYFDLMRNSLSQIEAISPIVAANIRDIVESATGASPEAIIAINQQLDLMKDKLESMAVVEAGKAFEESMSNSLIAHGAQVENITDGYEKWALRLYDFSDPLSELINGMGITNDELTNTIASLALNKRGIDDSKAAMDKLRDAWTKAGLAGKDSVDVVDAFGKKITVSQDAAKKMWQDWMESNLKAEEQLDSSVNQIFEMSKGFEDTQTGVTILLKQMEKNNNLSKTYVEQVKAAVQARMGEVNIAENMAEIQGEIADEIEKTMELDQVSEAEALEIALQNVNSELNTITNELGEAKGDTDDINTLIEEQRNAISKVFILQGKLAEKRLKEIEILKTESDLLDKNLITMGDLLKPMDAQLLKEKAILQAKLATLKQIKAEIENKLISVRATNSDIQAQNLLKQAVVNINAEIQKGNDLLAARAAGQYETVLTTEAADIEIKDISEVEFQFTTMLGNVNEQIAATEEGIKKVDEGLGKAASGGLSQFNKGMEDLRKKTDEALGSLNEQLEKARFDVDFYGAEDNEKRQAEEIRRYEDHLEDIRSEYGNHSEMIGKAGELHELNMTKLSLDEQTKRDKELEVEREKANKKRLDEEKKLQEEIKKAEEERMKRAKSFADFMASTFLDKAGRSLDILQSKLDLFNKALLQVENITTAKTGVDLIAYLESEINKIMTDPFKRSQEKFKKDLLDSAVSFSLSIDLTIDKIKKMIAETQIGPSGGVEFVYTTEQVEVLEEMIKLLEPEKMKQQGIELETSLTTVYESYVKTLSAMSEFSLEGMMTEIDKMAVVTANLSKNKIEYTKFLEQEVNARMIYLDAFEKEQILRVRWQKMGQDELEIQKTIAVTQLQINDTRINYLNTILNSMEANNLKEEEYRDYLIEIVEYQEKNKAILEAQIEPYESLNESAQSFLDQRNEGMEKELTQVQQINKEYDTQIDSLDDGIDKLEKEIEYNESLETQTETVKNLLGAQRSELEKMVILRGGIVELSKEELDIAKKAVEEQTRIALEETRRKIAEIDMTGYEKEKMAIEENADLEIKEAIRVFGERSQQLEEESSEWLANDKERVEAISKLEEKKRKDLSKLQMDKAKEVMNKIQSMAASVMNLIEGIGEMITGAAWESTESALAAISGVSSGIADVANQFGPVGETIGGAFSLISGIIDAIGDSINVQLSDEEMRTLELQKQLKLLGLQMEATEKLIQLGVDWLDEAVERTNAYQKQLQESLDLIYEMHGIQLETDDPLAVLEEINRLNEETAEYERRQAEHRKQGSKYDDEAARRLQGHITKNKEIVDQLDISYDLMVKINDSRKEEYDEVLNMIDAQTQLNGEVAGGLQQRIDTYEKMLADEDEMLGGFLLKGQERLDILDKINQAQREQLDIYETQDLQRLRLAGYDEDSIKYMQKQKQWIDRQLRDAEDLGLTQIEINDLLLDRIDITDRIGDKRKENAEEADEEVEKEHKKMDKWEKRLAYWEHEHKMERISDDKFQAKKLKFLQKMYKYAVAHNLPIEEQRRLEYEIYKLQQDQTAEMQKQGQIQDSEYVRLIRKRQELLRQARLTGEIPADVQLQLAKVEQNIVDRMRSLGIDETTIANAIAAMREQRSFQLGGINPEDQWIYAHAKEVITPSPQADWVENILPGWFESVRKAKTPGQIPIPTQPVPLIPNIPNIPLAEHDKTQIINLYFGENQFSISGTDTQSILTKLNEWNTNFSNKVISTLREKGIETTRK